MHSKPIEYAKDGGYWLTQQVNEKLSRGEIDEEGWHREIQAVIVPAYLSADTPWGQSGKGGDYALWESARRHLCEAIDRPGTFLDIGCASGFLMECIAAWSAVKIEPYGLDISPELADLARRRLPYWADRIWIGNALHWQPTMRFDFIRTGLEYVPEHRQRELVDHLLDDVLSPGGRLIIGSYNEERELSTIRDALVGSGFRVVGGSVRLHRDSRLAQRSVWIER